MKGRNAITFLCDFLRARSIFFFWQVYGWSAWESLQLGPRFGQQTGKLNKNSDATV